MNGNCFEAAVQTAVQIPKVKGWQVRIVHGLPCNQSPEHLGKRYWHAWVEVDNGSTIICIDRSNGLDIKLPQSMYYRIGNLDEQQVWRFSIDEALDAMDLLGHYGPWVDGWEEMEEV